MSIIENNVNFEDIESMDAAESLSRFIVQEHDKKPHLYAGLSDHASCTAEQILKRVFILPFTGHGGVMPGTAGHMNHEDYMKSGLVINDVNGIPTWLVIGHEQYVRVDDGSPRGRLSPIDNLVYNIRLQQFEVWDLKFTKIDTTYLNTVSRAYTHQVNLYGWTRMKEWQLPYKPIVRLIFNNKDDYTDKKQYAWRVREDWYNESIKIIKTVKFFTTNWLAINKNGVTKEQWFKLAEGLNWWNTNSKPYRYACKYCNHADICLSLVGKPEISCEENKWAYNSKLIF